MGRKKDPEVVKARIRKHTKTWALKAKYGLTIEQRDAIVAEQSNECAVCRQPLSDNARLVHIDHCHATMKVRGILCSWCNRGLGNFFDDPTKLYLAIDYLAAHQ